MDMWQYMPDLYDEVYVTMGVKTKLQAMLGEAGIEMSPKAILNEAWQKSDKAVGNLPLDLNGRQMYCRVELNNKDQDRQKFAITGVFDNPVMVMGLKDYAWLGVESEFLQSVRDIAMEEDWDDNSDPNGYGKNKILYNYLDYTFRFLLERGGVLETLDGKLSAFNTGLVDDKYDDVFIVFQMTGKRQEWQYLCCTTARMSAGRKYLDKFPRLPERAKYSEVSNLFIEPGQISVDFEHIFRDNFDRIPFDFVKRELMSIDEFADFLKTVSPDDREETKDFILGNQECVSKISDSIDLLVKQAERRWRWNFRTAIPIYIPMTRRIQFLLPLRFDNSRDFGAALVIEKMWARKNEYRGITILTPSMAYLDARLLCKPQSDWLKL